MGLTKAQRDSLRERRLLWPVKAAREGNIFQFPLDYRLRNRVLDWLAAYTEGEFYLGPNILYFCNDKDAMAYTLYDVRNKAEIN